MSGETILVIDDDSHIREVIGFALEKAGFAVIEAGDGAEGLRRFDESAPALVILDVLMPELDGTEVCRRIRAGSQVPIVFLSSRDEEIDRILGLELGGDDYVTKPFSPRELVARVRAVLRRVEGAGATTPADSQTVVRHGELTLDRERCQAGWGERAVVLTVTEFGILEALLAHPSRVYSRDELIDRAYREPTVVSARTIDSHIRRLRRKFAAVGGDPVETVHGFGYRLSSCRPDQGE